VKQKLAIKVYLTQEGDICIESPDHCGGAQRVFVTPEEVDPLILQLEEKRDEAIVSCSNSRTA
jgi:hypothetical protein